MRPGPRASQRLQICPATGPFRLEVFDFGLQPVLVVPSPYTLVLRGNPTGRESHPVPSLGTKIRQLRIAAGLTQRDLGEKVGVSFTHISKIEADKEPASADLLKRIARAVKSDPDELLLFAHKVPEDLSRVVTEKGEIAPRFLRSWKRGEFSDADVEQFLKRHKKE